MGAKPKTKLLWLVASLQLLMALLLVLTLTPKTHAAAGINNQLSFEGKIVNSNGTNITNGTYNLEFKIYQDGNGCIPTSGCSTDPSTQNGGTLKWTEDRLVGGSGGVTLTDGTFQVNLGSVNAFGSSVDWNQDTLWLSLQIGNTSSCTITTTFQSNCSGDGEMISFIRLTAVPYAMNAAKLGGLAASGFIQNSTSAQTANFNVQSGASGSIAAVIQGASGQSVDILDVKANGVANPVFAIGNTGNATFRVSTGNDSTTAFQVQRASGTDVLTVDTTNSKITTRGINSTATLSSELITSQAFNNTTYWTCSTGWTTTSTTAQHNTGNTNTCIATSTNLTVASAMIYQVSFNIAGSITAGEFVTVSIGGGSFAVPFGGGYTESLLINTVSTAALTFTPSSNYNGTISAVSVKALSTISNPVISINNSNNSAGVEVRSGGSALGNTFIGLSSGQSNVDGGGNTALGSASLQNNTSGGSNTAVGFGALTANANGYSNTALGVDSLSSNTSGGYNTAVGASSLTSTMGSHNTGLGYSSLNSNNRGNANVAIGDSALDTSTTGSNNTAVGANSLDNNDSGSGNTSLGFGALGNNITGSNNTAIGYNSGFQDPNATAFYTSDNLQNATAIGYGAQVQQSNSIVLGSVGTLVSNLTPNVGIGTTSPTNTFSVSPNIYDTGTACQGTNSSCNSSGDQVWGTGTTWTSSMVGMEFIFADGTKDTITSFTSATRIGVSGSRIKASQAYRIHNPAFSVSSTGSVGVRSSTDSATAFQVQNSAGLALFKIDTTGSGAVSIKSGSSTAFQVQNASNISVMVIDASAFALKVYDSTGSNYASISYSGGAAIFAASSGVTQIGNSSSGNVTIAITGESNVLTFSKTATLTASKGSSYSDYTITRNLTQGSFNTTNSNVLKVEDVSSATTASNIASTVLLLNQSNSGAAGKLLDAQLAGTSKFNVSVAGTVSIAAAQSYTGSGAVTLQAAASSALTITGNAASTWSTSSGALTITGAAASTWSTSAGLLTIQGGGGLTLNSAGTNAVNLDTGGAAAINIGGTNATSMVLGGNTSATITEKIANSSTTAYNLQTAGGTAYLTTNTTNTRIQIGSSTTDTTGILLVLDSYNNSGAAGDPGNGINGSMYYNTFNNKLRCYENSAWGNCKPGATISIQPGLATASVAATNLAASTLNCVSDPSLRVLTSLDGYTRIRIQGRFGGAVVAATTMRIQYSTSADPSIATGDASWTTLVSSAGSHTVNVWFYSTEASIPTAAQINPVQLRACVFGGDGVVDPTITGATLTVY